MERYDVIVVGVGAAGSAAVYELASRGVRVLGIERSTVPNATASHHGLTRVFRTCYYEHPDYVPLLQRALELWRRLEEDAGQRLLDLCGGFACGPEGSELITGMERAAAEHGLAMEALTRRGAAQRFPQFVVPEGHRALVEPAAGFVRCELAVGAFARLAMRSGATIRGEEPVRRWHASGDEVVVETDAGAYAAKRVIFACGAWMPRLSPPRTGLRVTRQVVTWVSPRRAGVFAGPGAPVWVVEHEGALFYGLPHRAGGERDPGMKVARHVAGGLVLDPDLAQAPVSAAEEAEIAAFLTARLPDAGAQIAARGTCFYTSTADGHFVIDRHPEHENVIIASACSGHGFKFAPVMGEILADLAMHGRTRHRIALFADGRGEAAGMKEGCSLCGAVRGESAGLTLVATLPHSQVFLNEQQGSRGWCMLVLRQHVEHLDELPAERQRGLFGEVARVARAIRTVFPASGAGGGPPRINYECLGNVTAHVHWHVIPRHADDPTPRAAVWGWTAEQMKGSMDAGERRALAEKLRAALLNTDG